MPLKNADDVPAFSAPSGRISPRRRPSSSSLSALVTRLTQRADGDDTNDCSRGGEETIEFSGPSERRPSASSLDIIPYIDDLDDVRGRGGGERGRQVARSPSVGSLGGMSHPGIISAVAASSDVGIGGGVGAGGGERWRVGPQRRLQSRSRSFGSSMMSIFLGGGGAADLDDTFRSASRGSEFQPNLAPIIYRRHSANGSGGVADDHEKWESRSHRSSSSELSRDSVAVRFTRKVAMITVSALAVSGVFASAFMIAYHRSEMEMSMTGTRSGGGGGGGEVGPTISSAGWGGAAKGQQGESDQSRGAPPQSIPEMPFPPSSGGQPYAYSLPQAMEHLADVTSPQRRGYELPVLLHAPLAGHVPRDVAVRCLGLVGAVGNGLGAEYDGQPLQVIDREGHKYVNVDMLTPEGIDRAASLDLSTSGMADFISTALLHHTAGSVFGATNQGRLFALMRHPIERAVASFHHLIESDPYLGEMTLEDYAAGPYAEGDWMTRFLSDHSQGPVTEVHAAMAKEVLRRKAVVGIYEEMEDSLHRMRAYFGWFPGEGDAAGEELYQQCQAQVLSTHPVQQQGVLKSRSHDGMVLREGDSTYEALAQRNLYDMELYRYARQLFAVQANLPIQVAAEVDPAEAAERWPPNRNCVENGHFHANPPLANWYAVLATLQAVPGADGTGKALQSVDRGHQVFGGMWQNIRTDCLHVGEWYEVKATVQATVAGMNTPFLCDPTIRYNLDEQSCPGIGLRIGEDMREVGFTVGPFKPEQQWMELYGVFQATSGMVSKMVSLFVSRAPPSVDIAVDNVSVKPAQANAVGITDCSWPVANGDAEIGDHRYWFIRGSAGAGRIEIISPGYGGSKHAFRHVGQREERWRGMLQSLDASCFPEMSAWTITAQFRYFSVDEAGKEVSAKCRKDNPKAANSCPVFALDFLARDGSTVTTGPLPNEVPGDVELGGWNKIRHTFSVTAEMALRPEVLLYVNSVDSGYNYELDAVEMSRIQI